MKCSLNIKPFLWTLLWLLPTLATWDLAFGSYGESEPKAGNILVGAGILFLLLGAFLYRKYKPTYILIKE